MFAPSEDDALPAPGRILSRHMIDNILGQRGLSWFPRSRVLKASPDQPNKSPEAPGLKRAEFDTLWAMLNR